MNSFSQRKDLKPVPTIQVDSMNDDLRNSLWNTLSKTIWTTSGFLSDRTPTLNIYKFSAILWEYYFKKPLDTLTGAGSARLRMIRDYFFSCEWNEVYEFLEFLVSIHNTPNLIKALNNVLERELAGYKFVAGHLTDVTNHEEIAMIEEALKDSRFVGVAAHIERSLELYADRKNPDYRNSIKESISAVESMSRVVSGNSNATLGDALKTIEKNGQLHKALKEGFLKLYGYTSDAQGIRHAMLDEPNLTAADARYFLVSCSSFVNYLKAQMP
jgi:AbiJ N-terminal domain 4